MNPFEVFTCGYYDTSSSINLLDPYLLHDIIEVMFSPVIPYQHFPGPFNPSSYEDLELTTHDTTPADFDAYCLSHDGGFGWNSLGVATYYDDLPLIRHIVNIGGDMVINSCNQSDWTPLMCAVTGDKLMATRLLLELGAYVNMTSRYNIYDHLNVTPLWYAKNVSNNVNIINLLIDYGGISYTEN